MKMLVIEDPENRRRHCLFVDEGVVFHPPPGKVTHVVRVPPRSLRRILPYIEIEGKREEKGRWRQ